MVKKIIINSSNDDAYIINGSHFRASGAQQVIQGDKALFNLMDDCDIEVPAGNYDCLTINTSNGDFEINLPNCHFKKVVLNSSNGDISLSTSFDDIESNTSNGDIEPENLNINTYVNNENDYYKQEPIFPNPKKAVSNIRTATSTKSQFKEPTRKNNRDRYF